jgi:hypothetical protein
MGVSLATRGFIGFVGKLINGDGIGSGEAFGRHECLPYFFAIPTQQIPLTANGSSQGYIDIPPNYLEFLEVGTIGWLNQIGNNQQVIIAKIESPGRLYVRFQSSYPHNYGYNDCSVFLTPNANLSIERQYVINELVAGRFQI